MTIQTLRSIAKANRISSTSNSSAWIFNGPVGKGWSISISKHNNDVRIQNVDKIPKEILHEFLKFARTSIKARIYQPVTWKAVVNYAKQFGYIDDTDETKNLSAAQRLMMPNGKWGPCGPLEYQLTNGVKLISITLTRSFNLSFQTIHKSKYKSLMEVPDKLLSMIQRYGEDYVNSLRAAGKSINASDAFHQLHHKRHFPSKIPVPLHGVNLNLHNPCLDPITHKTFAGEMIFEAIGHNVKPHPTITTYSSDDKRVAKCKLDRGDPVVSLVHVLTCYTSMAVYFSSVADLDWTDYIYLVPNNSHYSQTMLKIAKGVRKPDCGSYVITGLSHMSKTVLDYLHEYNLNFIGVDEEK